MQSHQREFAALLASLFTPDEWYRWLRTEYIEVSDRVSRNTPAELFEESVDCLIRFGHFDADFFAKLIALRPKRQNDIETVSKPWTAAHAALRPSLAPQATRVRSAPGRSIFLPVSAAFLLGMAATVITQWFITPAGIPTAPRAMLEACQSSFLNLEDDQNYAATFEDLRTIVREHAIECRPLLQQLTGGKSRPDQASP